MIAMSRAVRALLLVSLCLSPSLYAQVPNTWSPTGNLPAPLSKYTLTLLASGQALAAAGCNDFFCNTPSRGSSTYDPNTRTWTATASMPGLRRSHTSTRLQDGRVLLTGGIGRCDSQFCATLSS